MKIPQNVIDITASLAASRQADLTKLVDTKEQLEIRLTVINSQIDGVKSEIVKTIAFLNEADPSQDWESQIRPNDESNP